MCRGARGRIERYDVSFMFLHVYRCSYTSEAPEMQLRRLGDLTFMFQLYEQAYQTYHTCKRDFNNDHAWLHYAGALVWTCYLNSTGSCSTPACHDLDYWFNVNPCMRLLYIIWNTIEFINNWNLPDNGESATRLLETTNMLVFNSN